MESPLTAFRDLGGRPAGAFSPGWSRLEGGCVPKSRNIKATCAGGSSGLSAICYPLNAIFKES